MQRCKRKQKIAGGRAARENTTAAPCVFLAHPPDPLIRESRRPCVEPKLQNLIWSTPPFCFAKFGGFTGDQQYSPPRYRQNLFLMLLTSVARRGHPVGDASESRYVQRGSAAKNYAAQFGNAGAVFSGCLYSSLIHPGPKARMAGQQNQGMRTGRKRGLWGRTPHGDRGRSPGDFLGTFVSLQKYLARGRNISITRPARRR